MGTRHLTLAVVDQTVKLAQYGQWDGYPSGQGATVLRFCKEFAGRPKHEQQTTVQRFANLRAATEADFAAQYAEAGVKQGGTGWVTIEESDRLKAARPAFSRDIGAEVLAMVANGDVQVVSLQENFALDGLFCEWAWLIDFDRRVLECYSGFRKTGEPVAGRWADQTGATEGYAPVSLLRTYSFDELPEQTDFENTLEPEQVD